MGCIKHANFLRFDVFESINDEALQFFDFHLILIKMVLFNIV